MVSGRPGTNRMKTHILNGGFKLAVLLVQFARPGGAGRLSGLHSLEAQRLFFNRYMKRIRFLCGAGNASLAIVLTNCGCLNCQRPGLKPRVDLWLSSSSDLVKSSLLLLQLPAAPSPCVSPYGCLRSWPQSSTWGASGSRQCVKSFTCPRYSLGWKMPYRSIKKSNLSYFCIFQALKKEQIWLTVPNLEPSLLCQSHATHLPDCPSEMG